MLLSPSNTQDAGLVLAFRGRELVNLSRRFVLECTMKDFLRSHQLPKGPYKCFGPHRLEANPATLL